MSALLHLDKFSAAYGEVPVVSNVSLDLAPGEIMALTGRNGMGKTTLLRGIIGLTSVRRGTAEFAGGDIAAQPAEMISRAGIAYVPAGREIFGSLSVRENLIMCARGGEDGNRWTFERVMALFPRLGERISHGGKQLSGGEQQMLAVGRALMTNPDLILIDEATEGLAPMVAEVIWQTLAKMRDNGVATLVVDKDFRALSRLANRVLLMTKGEIAFSGTPAELKAQPELLEKHLGV